jgi:hypothetical protein
VAANLSRSNCSLVTPPSKRLSDIWGQVGFGACPKRCDQVEDHYPCKHMIFVHPTSRRLEPAPPEVGEAKLEIWSKSFLSFRLGNKGRFASDFTTTMTLQRWVLREQVPSVIATRFSKRTQRGR